MMLLIEEIAEYLHAKGIVNYDATGTSGNTFLHALPTSPDECVAIYQNPGTQADPENEYRQPAVQFLVRSIQYEARHAIEWGQQIIDALSGFNSGYFTTGGRYVIDCIAQQSAPANIGTDQNERHELSFNFLIEFQK